MNRFLCCELVRASVATRIKDVVLIWQWRMTTDVSRAPARPLEGLEVDLADQAATVLVNHTLLPSGLDGGDDVQRGAYPEWPNQYYFWLIFIMFFRRFPTRLRRFITPRLYPTVPATEGGQVCVQGLTGRVVDMCAIQRAHTPRVLRMRGYILSLRVCHPCFILDVDAPSHLSHPGSAVYLFGNTTGDLGYAIRIDEEFVTLNSQPEIELLHSSVGLGPGPHSITLFVQKPLSISNPGSVTFREAVVTSRTGYSGYVRFDRERI